jgi:hypothetical protein
MRWSDLPARTTLEAARKNEFDLSNLPWEPSERSVDDAIVRLALRNGVVCAIGLVLDAGDLTVLDHPGDIRASYEGVKRSRAKLAASPTGDLMEHIMPGWKEDDRRMDAVLEESTMQAIEEAEVERAELLEAEPVQDLIDHWKDLGGRLPSSP